MQKNVFEFLGRRIELWTHPDPDPLGRAIRSTRTFYDLDLLMKCREIYLPGTAIVDVGANIGNHAVFFTMILNAPVYAFEPFRPNHVLLEINIAANGLEGQIVAPCCATEEAAGSASPHPGPPENLGEGETPVRSLDGCAIPGPIGLLKVDVEGGELSVLRGAEALIDRWRPDIVVKAGTQTEFWHVADLLAGHSYIPHGRFGATPTYLFSALDQITRLERMRTDL